MKILQKKELESLLNSKIDEITISPIYKNVEKTEVDYLECKIKFKTNIKYINQLLEICKPDDK
jgi:hypothetical protein